MTDAIDYALKSGNLRHAANLIESNAQNTIQQSEISTFIRWVEQLPESLIHSHPDLCIYYAWTLLVSSQKPEIAERCLQIAGEYENLASGKLNAVRSVQAAFQRKVAESLDLARQALEQLPEDEYFFRQIAGWNLSAALFLSGEVAESIDVLNEVARVSLASGNRMVAVVSLCRLGNIQLQQGNLYSADAHYQRALSIASENRKTPLPVASEALIGLGRIQWEWYQFENAENYLSEGLALSRFWREVSSIEGHITNVHLQISLGKINLSARAMQKIREIINREVLADTGKQYVSMQEAYIQLRQGNLHFAQSWAEQRNLSAYYQVEKLEPSDSPGADLVRNFELLLYTRVLLAESRFDDALRILKMLLPAFSILGHRVKLIETHILMAIVLSVKGQQDKAGKFIKSALDLAVSADFKRVFVDEGPRVLNLLEQIQTEGDSANFTQEILAVWPKSTSESKLEKDTQVLSVRLSDREIEVLRLLISDLTVPEIADRIHISVSTLRTHIRNIYRKLDTHSRYETVTKAKDIGII
jgi:LuxR family maltose regulon positive regulatory protein